MVDVIKVEVEELFVLLILIEMLIKVIKSVNIKLFEYSSDFLGNKMVGIIVIVLFFKDNKYLVIWVGDSRIYFYRLNVLL